MNFGQCIFCALRFAPNDVTTLKNCGHTFHFKCIEKWITTSKTCPICRAPNTKPDIVKLFFGATNSSSSIPQQNYWDANACHNNNDLTIYGHNNLTIHRNGNAAYGRWWWRSPFAFDDLWRSVFAEYSILNSTAFFGAIFYFEISIRQMKGYLSFGIAVKHQAPLDGTIRWRNGTYAYDGDGYFMINGTETGGNEAFVTNDTVGCGLSLANRQLFFTKNGRRIVPTDLHILSSLPADELYPFVSLRDNGDKIEANFGTKNFKFDLATLC